MPADQAEALEARIRREMARHAAIKPRGFDSERERREIHQSIDKLYDRWFIAVACDRHELELAE